MNAIRPISEKACEDQGADDNDESCNHPYHELLSNEKV
jgi:hypothetical protein